MTQEIENLLKYQEEDEKLHRIDQEINSSPERKEYAQIRNFLLKTAPERLRQLDDKGTVIEELAKDIAGEIAELEESLKEFDNMTELVENGGADISFYKKNASKISSDIKKLRSRTEALESDAAKTKDEFQKLKKETIARQNDFNTRITIAYKNLVDSRKGEKDEINKSMDDIKKGIGTPLMEKYDAKRSEKIHPIICRLTKDGRCSQCGETLPIKSKEEINRGDIAECDRCHRILYKAD